MMNYLFHGVYLFFFFVVLLVELEEVFSNVDISNETLPRYINL